MKRTGIINLKGGVGKSTTTANIAYYLAKMGFNVLIIDADTQENETEMLMGADRKFPVTLYDFMIDPLNIRFDQAIYPYAGPEASRPALQTKGRICIVPGHRLLGFVEGAFNKNRVGQPIQLVHEAIDYGLKQVEGQFDWVLVDPGPNWGPITDAVVYAVHGIVVPFEPAPMTFISFRHLLEELADSNARIWRQGHQTTIYGVVFTKCHDAYQRQIAGGLKGNFSRKGINCFGPLLNWNVASMEMVTAQLPLPAFIQERPELLHEGKVMQRDLEDLAQLTRELVEVSK